MIQYWIFTTWATGFLQNRKIRHAKIAQPIQASGALPGLNETRGRQHAPQPARLDTSGPLLQWLHLIRAYSYPDLGIVGSSHLCYDFSHKIHRIGMKEIQGGTERIYPRMLPGVSAAVTGSCASTHFVVRFCRHRTEQNVRKKKNLVQWPFHGVGGSVLASTSL